MIVSKEALMQTRMILALTLVVALSACEKGTGGGNGPTSESALLEIFREAYDGGDRERILQLVLWDDVPSDVREAMEAVLCAGAGEFRIEEIKLDPWDASEFGQPELNGRRLKPNVDPVRRLRATCKKKDESMEGTIWIEAPVGIVGGAYFISGIVYE